VDGSVKVSGLFVDGNTDRRAIGASFDAARKTELDRLSADASWDYSEDKDNDTTSRPSDSGTSRSGARVPASSTTTS
jgi:hypothetical protein